MCSSAVGSSQKYEAGLRHELTFLGFISTPTVYDPLYTYRASGGIGAYNASYPPFTDPNNDALLASEVSAAVLSTRSGQITLSQGPGFSSHLLTGGIAFMQPISEINGNNFSAADSVFAHQQLGTQIDIWYPVTQFVATAGDCKIWGIPSYALSLCIAPAPGNASALIAGTMSLKEDIAKTLGVSGCFDDPTCFSNLTWTESLDFSVTIAFSQRAADVVYERATPQDITAFSNLSHPTPEIIAPSDLFIAFESLFGPDYTSTGMLGDGSSTTSNLLYNYIDVFTGYNEDSAEPIDEIYVNTLGGLISLPILMFQPTSGVGPNPDPDLTQPEVGLVPNLYFSLDLSESKIIAVIPRWVAIVYLVISAIIYACCIAAIVLSFQGPSPPVSSLEMIDFASKAVPMTGKSTSRHF